MAVEVVHDGETATEILPAMRRAPWTTCPGAEAQLKDTFTGVKLADFPSRGQKKANCTHLYDIAQLAAAHAADPAPAVYDILVSDPEDGKRRAELRRGENCLIGWTERNFEVLEPEELRGMNLAGDLTPWVGERPPEIREAARLLRWGTMLANGRTIPLEEQSDATKMPPNCYTFQPERAVIAERVGLIRDFSEGSAEPLGEYESPQ